MKAYLWQDNEDMSGGVVFAHTSAHARRLGAEAYADGDFHTGTARRAPSLDQYTSTRVVPATALLALGWWLECSHCYRRFDQDVIHDGDWDEQVNPVGTDTMPFCSPECRDKEAAEQLRRRRMEALALSLAWRRLARVVPGARPKKYEHAYVTDEGIQQVVVGFTFPGCQYGGGTLRYDRDEGWRIHMAQGDLDAWYAFYQ